MFLTQPQLVILKNDIAADATLNALPQGNEDNATVVANSYNLNAVPDYWVWRTAVSRGELTNATSVDGTIFSWVGSGFITRAQGERDAWRELFDDRGFVNPSLTQVRQAFADIFSGAIAPAPANRTHLNTISRRKANRAEKLYITTGVGTTAAPSTLVVEGIITVQNVVAAWNS